MYIYMFLNVENTWINFQQRKQRKPSFLVVLWKKQFRYRFGEPIFPRNYDWLKAPESWNSMTTQIHHLHLIESSSFSIGNTSCKMVWRLFQCVLRRSKFLLKISLPTSWIESLGVPGPKIFSPAPGSSSSSLHTCTCTRLEPSVLLMDEARLARIWIVFPMFEDFWRTELMQGFVHQHFTVFIIPNNKFRQNKY